ncbi:polysaccharide deacetylase family protein [Burkholderia thailandensis]|uniref:polysaccharide deacetylase family protein n=1 Tax=Burkholderia thailandensis TaxID=57975 RepID=UPI00148ECE12|nr:polysaccharide deacetylase family protein [Burkholderia thailandensis]NOK48140.1 polysaccharide deacetylase family protein [Burkholderia thailandensis]
MTTNTFDTNGATAAPSAPERRDFLARAGGGLGLSAAGLTLGAAAAPANAIAAAATAGVDVAPASPGDGSPRRAPAGDAAHGAFWPNGARLVISISMQFEAGGQPPTGADSPFPHVDFPPQVPVDLASATWFAYGYREGIPRMLDLWDRHGVKVTSHMIGEAVRHRPDLAREIVARGHEAAGHGPRWSSQYALSRDEERRFLIAARDMVEAETGARPVGYNCNWLRRGPNTLPLLQELGYLYHIDDVSRDEPFIEQVNGRDFVVVPYTLRNNDILLIEGRNYSPGQFLDQIKLDFDQLYDEAATRRRMMSISAHDRISGTPQMVRAWDAFLRYAKSHPGVAFMRKDDIARHALHSPLTLRESETL